MGVLYIGVLYIMVTMNWAREELCEASPVRVARGSSTLAYAEWLGNALRCGAAMQLVERRI